MISLENSRTAMLLGEEASEKLSKSRVAVFGIGGVGGYAAEALARAGIGRLDLVDADKISVSNINRQIIALHSTVGRFKTEVMAERIKDINPGAEVRTFNLFFSEETAGQFDFSQYDCVIDAVDTVSAKLLIAVRAEESSTPVISCMGAGNKLDPTAFEVADIYKTTVCPLARVMRRELKKRGIKKLKVVYSKEEPKTPLFSPAEEVSAVQKSRTPGSVSFVPSAAGLIAAGEAVKQIAACAR